MVRLLLLILVVSFLLSACSGDTPSLEAGQSAEQVTSAPQQYEDANVALADGSRFLDEGDTDRAIDALTQAVKLNPDLAEAWFKLGIAYALVEKREETMEMANVGQDEPANKSSRVKTNSEKAFEKAVAAYKKIIDANDEDDVAHFNLGRAYNKLNEDEDAAKALKQAVKLKPDDTEYQTELGAILIKLAQYHEAIAPLKKALELDPENIRAQELLEDAEAGRKRVNYTSTPKDEKKPSNSSSNSNTAAPSDQKTPPPTPDPTTAKPRPTPARPKE